MTNAQKDTFITQIRESNQWIMDLKSRLVLLQTVNAEAGIVAAITQDDLDRVYGAGMALSDFSACLPVLAGINNHLESGTPKKIAAVIKAL